MCERCRSRTAQNAAADALRDACTQRRNDLLRQGATIFHLPGTIHTPTFDSLIREIDAADDEYSRGKHNGRR